jgi:hypothetical protein
MGRSASILKLMVVALACLLPTVGPSPGHAQIQSAPVKPGVKTEPASEGKYTLVLQKVHGKNIWFDKVGVRDLATLSFRVCDTGRAAAADGCMDSVTMFRVRNGQTIFPVDNKKKPLRLYGPAPIKGDLEIDGTLLIAHPQKFKNVYGALKAFAGLAGAAVQEYGASEDDQQVSAVGKFMQKEEAKQAYANLNVELVKAAGRIGCAGANPLAITWSNSNTLTPAEVRNNTNKSFKLLSFHKGSQAKTCWQDIVYDPLQAILSKE